MPFSSEKNPSIIDSLAAGRANTNVANNNNDGNGTREPIDGEMKDIDGSKIEIHINALLCHAFRAHYLHT